MVSSFLISEFHEMQTRNPSGAIGGCAGRWGNSVRQSDRPVLIGGGGTSEFVTFDFDALTHKAGLTSDQLSAVKDAAFAPPYVEVRRSSGGAGFHLYVTLDSIPSANHTEHAQLAKAVLKKMSKDSGFDFAKHVDACGGNCWVYHKKATAENRGFELIKGATE